MGALDEVGLMSVAKGLNEPTAKNLFRLLIK